MPGWTLEMAAMARPPEGAGPLHPGNLDKAAVVGGLGGGHLSWLGFLDDHTLALAGGGGLRLVDPDSLVSRQLLGVDGWVLRVWPQPGGLLYALAQGRRGPRIWRVDWTTDTCDLLTLQVGSDLSAIDLAAGHLFVGQADGSVRALPLDGGPAWSLLAPDEAQVVFNVAAPTKVFASPDGSVVAAEVASTTLVWPMEPGALPEVLHGAAAPCAALPGGRLLDARLTRVTAWDTRSGTSRQLNLRDADALYDAGLVELRMGRFGHSTHADHFVCAVQGGGVLVHPLAQDDDWWANFDELYRLPVALPPPGGRAPPAGPEPDLVAANARWVAAHDPRTGHVSTWRRGRPDVLAASAPCGTPTLRTFAVGGGVAALRLARDPRAFRLTDGTLQALSAGLVGDLSALAVSSDGQRIIVGCASDEAGSVHLLNAVEGEALHMAAVRDEPVAVAGLPGGDRYVCLSQEAPTGRGLPRSGQVDLLDRTRKRVAARDKGDRCQRVAVSLDGSALAVLWGTPQSGFVRTYDLRARRMPAVGDSSAVPGLCAIALHPHGGVVYGAAAHDGTSRLLAWRAGAARPVRSALFGGEATSVAASACGELVFLGTTSGRIRVVHASTFDELAALDGHRGPVLGLTVDQGMLWSWGGDGLVCVWGEPGAAQDPALALPVALPDLALDEPLNYGPRSFRLEVSPGLQLCAVAADGTRSASMPRARRADDSDRLEAVREQWKQALSAVAAATSTARRVVRQAYEQQVWWPVEGLAALPQGSVGGAVARGLLWETEAGVRVRLRGGGWVTEHGPVRLSGARVCLVAPSQQDDPLATELLDWLTPR